MRIKLKVSHPGRLCVGCGLSVSCPSMLVILLVCLLSCSVRHPGRLVCLLFCFCLSSFNSSLTLILLFQASWQSVSCPAFVLHPCTVVRHLSCYVSHPGSLSFSLAILGILVVCLLSCFCYSFLYSSPSLIPLCQSFWQFDSFPAMLVILVVCLYSPAMSVNLVVRLLSCYVSHPGSLSLVLLCQSSWQFVFFPAILGILVVCLLSCFCQSSFNSSVTLILLSQSSCQFVSCPAMLISPVVCLLSCYVSILSLVQECQSSWQSVSCPAFVSHPLTVVCLLSVLVNLVVCLLSQYVRHPSSLSLVLLLLVIL